MPGEAGLAQFILDVSKTENSSLRDGFLAILNSGKKDDEKESDLQAFLDRAGYSDISPGDCTALIGAANNVGSQLLAAGAGALKY